VWGYDVDSNGRFVYNALKSQQPIWAETDMLQIIARALQMCGVSLQIGAVMQYAQNIKDGGQ
jgi:hypothetical protein